MKISRISVIATIIVFSLFLVSLKAQCCKKLSSDSTRCLECPSQMRIYKGHCLFTINNCRQYGNGVQCSKCKNGYVVTPDGYCQKSSLTIDSPSQDIVDRRIPNWQANDNILILEDYGKSVYQHLQKSEVQQALIRTFKNGTDFTIIQLKGKEKYYELAAEFYKDVPFLFELKYYHEYDEKPPIFLQGQKNQQPRQEQKNQQTPNNNNTNNSNNNDQNNDDRGGTETQYGKNVLNYDFLTKKEREDDEGYKAIDRLLKLKYSQQLGDRPIVIAAYRRFKGYNGEYMMFYESTSKKRIYENKSVYNFARRQTFILSFTETYLRN